jgi:mannosyltransferase
MTGEDLERLEVVIPNLHWRYSGVTATNRMIAPRIARLCRTAWFGPDAPEGVARLRFRDLLSLRFRHAGRRARIWHARRNNEMIVGLLLRICGWRLHLVFTSAAQRHHTWITRFLIARMDAVIATSEAAASYLRRAATVIHHGVDPDAYAPPPDRGGAYAATGLPGTHGIGCFGRVRAQKGTDVFIDAMCRLLPRYPAFTAVIVGAVTPEERAFAEALRSRVDAAGLADRVRLLGELPVDEVPLWYQRISIYVFASRVEGFGLTLLEAMAAENAVVAARAGAAEVLITDGETGQLVPPGDVDALVAALEPLLRDPERAAAMGRRARARVVSDFSIDAEAGKIVKVYRKAWADARA